MEADTGGGADGAEGAKDAEGAQGVQGATVKGRNSFTLVLFVMYLLALAWLILLKLQFYIPYMDDGRIINLIPLMGSFDENGVIRLGEIALNILALVPLGIFICALDAPPSSVNKVLVIAGLTVVFEAAQYAFAMGRADITDVLSNTLGGIIGIGVYTLMFRALKHRTNEMINALAAAFAILAAVIAALLLMSHRLVGIK